MNKNKCVKKKLSKKNKIKIKHKTNKFLYKIHGGSNISAIVSNTQQKNAIHTTLQTLIKNPKVARVIIMFKGLKIKCTIGENKIEFNKDNNELACITLKYDFVDTNAELYNFFYSKSKSDCISSDSNINNTEYRKTHTTPPTYNKDLNKLLLTLIDIINIELKMTHCNVADTATINCNKIEILLDIKNYEKGYGFYNEFGYIYINKIPIPNLESKITYANTILTTNHILSHTTIIDLDEQLKAYIKTFDVGDILKDLLKLIKKFTSKDYKHNTLNKLLNELIKFMCEPTNLKIIETLSEKEKTCITSFTQTMRYYQNLKYEHNFYLDKYKKFYDYTKYSRIYKSELNIPSDENPVPSFEMKEFIKPNITINSSGISGDKYIINIVYL